MSTTHNQFNLTKAALLGRLTVRYGLVVLVVLVVGRTFFSAAISFWKAMNPPPPPAPTVGFGYLPAIKFPVQSATDKPSGYKLEIAASKIPDFPDRAKVILMQKSTPSFLADQRARAAAGNYGFLFNPDVLSERVYRWTKTSPIQKTLEMDILNLSFDLTSDFLTRPEVLGRRPLPNETAAAAMIRGFVAAGQELPTDIATPSAQTKYLRATAGELSAAVSISEADFVQVDIFRADIDNQYPVVTSKLDRGAIHGIISGGAGSTTQASEQIYELHYFFQPADYSQVHTYPLRSVQSAWQILQAGEGYIASKGQLETAIIRGVFLGYYDADEEQEFLQPIYVFTGDQGFVGYVSAVDPSTLAQPELR